MSFEEYSIPATACSAPSVHQLHSGNTFDEVVSDMKFLLPLSLIGLDRIAHGTIYQDAVQYLMPSVLVEMLVKYGIRGWERMEFETILGKILCLKHGAEARSMIPAQSTEDTREEALLRYLRRARDDQFRRCIREHRKLREIDEEVAQLSHKVGRTSNDVGEVLGDEDEDKVTFIDDERVSSRSQSGDEGHSATLTEAL